MLQNRHMTPAHRRKHSRSQNKQPGTRRENRLLCQHCCFYHEVIYSIRSAINIWDLLTMHLFKTLTDVALFANHTVQTSIYSGIFYGVWITLGLMVYRVTMRSHHSNIIVIPKTPVKYKCSQHATGRIPCSQTTEKYISWDWFSRKQKQIKWNVP